MRYKRVGKVVMRACRLTIGSVLFLLAGVIATGVTESGPEVATPVPLGIDPPFRLVRQLSFRDGRTSGFVVEGADSSFCRVLFQPALRDLRADSTIVDWRILVRPADPNSGMGGFLPKPGKPRVFPIGSPEEARLIPVLERLASQYFEGVDLDTLKVVACLRDLTTWQKAERVGVSVTRERKLAFHMLRELRYFDLERERRAKEE